MRILACLLLTLVVSSCATVQTQTLTTSDWLESTQQSVLMNSGLSSRTVDTITASGLSTQECQLDLPLCVERLGVASKLEASVVHAALAEVYLAAASSIAKRSSCSSAPTDGFSEPSPPKQAKDFQYSENKEVLQQCRASLSAAYLESLRFAYAYLFLDESNATDRIFSERQNQVKFFYDTALIRLLSLLDPSAEEFKTGSLSVGDYQIKLDQSQLNFGRQVVSVTPSGPLQIKGLKTQSKRDGFGTDFVAAFEEASALKLGELIMQQTRERFSSEEQDAASKVIEGSELDELWSRVVPAGSASITMVLAPEGDTFNQQIGSKTFKLQLYNPLATDQINIGQASYPLSANFSAPYAVWLETNRYAQAGYLNFFAGFEALAKPRLYLLEPYNPDKMVVIMIHGLASSPASWNDVTNTILGDPILRDHFQIWQVFYSPNLPIIESRLEIQRLIELAFKQNAQNSTDPAQHNAVVVSHSMGAVIARMMLSNQDLRSKVVQDMDSEAAKQLMSDPDFTERFSLQALGHVNHAVFMSAPFAGTQIADKWYTTALRKLARLPSAFLGELSKPLQTVINGQDTAKAAGLSSLFTTNGASQLSDKSRFIALTKDLNVDPKVSFDLIIGKLGDEPLEQSSDGVVPYSSAHISGAESETIIEAGHSLQNEPKTLLTLRTLLKKHAERYGDAKASKGSVSLANVQTADQIAKALPENQLKDAKPEVLTPKR